MNRIIVLLFCCVLVAGCAYLPLPVRHPAPSVETLLEQHQYLSALKALRTQRSNSRDYEAQRDAILAQASQYRDTVLRDASALQQQQQFAQAQQLLEAAGPELPQSREFDQFNEQFYAARDLYLQIYLDELVRLRALPLVRERSTYLALQKAASTPELQQAVARHQSEVDYLAPLIANAGAQALEQGEFTRAAQYLAAANQLAPSLQLAQQLKSAEQAIAANRQKKQIARITEREQRYRDLNYALHQSLDQRDFLAARDQLGQARALGVHSDELDALQKQLDELIANFVAQHVSSGDRHYADGRIEEALQHWRQADLLLSTPELKEKIDKAQKFIGRLHQLQKTPAKATRINSAEKP